MRIAIPNRRTSKSSVLLSLAGISLTFASNFSYAENFENGFDAYERGDFSNALRVFHLVAEQEYQDVQLNFGASARAEESPQDNVYAYMRWSIAASNGSDMGQEIEKRSWKR